MSTHALLAAIYDIVQHVFEEARQNGFPCFYQADLLVRSLLHDKAVGYVPPFIVLQQRDTAYGMSTL